MATRGRNPHAPAAKLRRRVQISHLLPVLFLSTAHILLDLTGWRGAQAGFTPGTLLLNLGLFLLAVITAIGLALSLAGWVAGPIRRLTEMVGSPRRLPSERWRPLEWEIDPLARRVISLVRQNRRGLDALSEVEAVRDRAAKLLTGWGESRLPVSPGLETRPDQFWGSAGEVLAGRVEDLSRSVKDLGSRISKCREISEDISKDLMEATIQTESLFLETSHRAVTQSRKEETQPDSILEELRSGLERWSGEIQGVADEEASARVNAWREWILHLLEEEESAEPETGSGLESRLESLSRKMEMLGRRCDSLSADVEACRILAMEIPGALPALNKDEPLVRVS